MTVLVVKTVCRLQCRGVMEVVYLWFTQLKSAICLYCSLHFYIWHCQPLVTFPECFEILHISYKHMLQPIFVCALHCTPDGIGVFLAYTCLRLLWGQNMGIRSTFLEMKVAFSRWGLCVRLKAGKLIKQTYHILWEIIAPIYTFCEELFLTEWDGRWLNENPVSIHCALACSG